MSNSSWLFAIYVHLCLQISKQRHNGPVLCHGQSPFLTSHCTFFCRVLAPETPAEGNGAGAVAGVHCCWGKDLPHFFGCLHPCWASKKTLVFSSKKAAFPSQQQQTATAAPVLLLTTSWQNYIFQNTLHLLTQAPVLLSLISCWNLSWKVVGGKHGKGEQ